MPRPVFRIGGSVLRSTTPVAPNTNNVHEDLDFNRPVDDTETTASMPMIVLSKQPLEVENKVNEEEKES